MNITVQAMMNAMTQTRSTKALYCAYIEPPLMLPTLVRARTKGSEGVCHDSRQRAFV